VFRVQGSEFSAHKASNGSNAENGSTVNPVTNEMFLVQMKHCQAQKWLDKASNGSNDSKGNGSNGAGHAKTTSENASLPTPDNESDAGSLPTPDHKSEFQGRGSPLLTLVPGRDETLSRQGKAPKETGTLQGYRPRVVYHRVYFSIRR